MNIYSQRKQKSMPRPLPKEQPPPTSTSESQTELSCPPFKAVSLQTKPQFKTVSSQTSLETPSPHRQPTKKLVPAGTQTEISTGIEEADSSSSRGVHVGADKTSGASVKESRQLISETLQPRKEAYSPDSRARIVATELTARSNETDKGKLATLASNQKDDGSKEAVDEERQKKDLLLARLRALDGQKGPPGSEPVRVGGLVKSSAEPTTNEPVDLSRPGAVAPTGGSGTNKPAATATVQRQATLKRGNAVVTPGGDGSSAEAEAKKKLLLAKLMAIDEGKDPSKAVANQQDSTKEPSKPDAKLTSSATHSDSSLMSWPDKIENMYQGKPAYASDGDPFGSRHSLSATKESAKADSSAVTTESRKEAKPKFGRRQPSQKPAASSKLDLLGGGPVKKSEFQAGAEKKPSSYKPSLVRRRAGNAASNPARNGTIFGGLDLETESNDTVTSKRATTGEFNTNTASDSHPIAGRSRDYPWETRVDISLKPSEPVLSSLKSNKKSGVTSMAKGPLSSAAQIFSGGLGSGHTSAAGSRPLLPLRPKAEPVAVSSFDPMPGSVIGEPDDIEEIVL